MPYAYVFLFSLFGTFILFRFAIYAVSAPITEIAVHTREGLKFHHLHFGVVAVFVGVLLLLLNAQTAAFLFLGFGLGAIFDEFIPSLYLKEPEPYTTSLYRAAFQKTVALFLLLLVCIFAVMAASAAFVR